MCDSSQLTRIDFSPGSNHPKFKWILACQTRDCVDRDSQRTGSLPQRVFARNDLTLILPDERDGSGPEKWFRMVPDLK